MKTKVVCVDCSASVEWEEDDLNHFVCPKCECDDYNLAVRETKRKIVPPTPKEEPEPEFVITKTECGVHITDTLGNEIKHDNGKLEIQPEEEEMEEQSEEINPIVEKQLGGLVTDLSSVLRNCDIPLNRVSFDYDVDDISVEVTIRRP